MMIFAHLLLIASFPALAFLLAIRKNN